MSQRDAAQHLPAQAVSRAAGPSCSPVWSQLLRVSYREESLPGEKLLLAVVNEGTGRPILKAAVPVGGLVPGARAAAPPRA